MTEGQGRVARQLRRRRRRELYGGVTVVVLGIVVLVVAIIALSHPRQRGAVAGTATRTIIETVTPSAGSNTPTSSTSKPPSSSSGSSSSDSATADGRQPLIVLNNTTVTGLAEKAAARFEAGGWTVTSYGNYQNTILSTCAYYDPSIAGAEAAALQLQQQFPAIKRVVAKFAGLPAGPIVVVLTDDYS